MRNVVIRHASPAACGSRRQASPLRAMASWLLAAAAALVPLSAANLALGANESRPPNIVLIVADDLGYGHLGSYGQKRIQTPRLDEMASEGMRFLQCYAGSNVCAPSRSTLMTGQHTGHTPVRANGGKRFLYDSDVTVAEVLRGAGYATGGFGKWGLGDEDTPGAPWRQGFDEWFGQYSQVHAHFFYPYYLWHNQERYPLPGNEGKRRSQYAHDEIHAKALDFIRRHKDERFFCYVPYTLPHVELVVPEDSLRPYAGKFPKMKVDDPRPGYIGSDDALATYAGMISRLDRGVGEILDLLDELGIDEQTLVLFTSDNGAQGGTWQPVAVDFFQGNGPLRGAKGDFYEGGIRVPMIARWPGRIAPGTTSGHVCAFWDMLPTLAEVAGAPVPAQIDGISFLPTLLGKGQQQEHEFLYWEYPSPPGDTHAVRMGEWKAVRPRPGGALELYNLAADLGETRDLAAQRPELIEKIEAIIAREHTPERDYEPDPRRRGAADFVR